MELSLRKSKHFVSFGALVAAATVALEVQAQSAPAPNLNGTWCFRGIPGRIARISQSSTEAVTASHRKRRPFKGLRGEITNSGERIDWSNGENWQRYSQ
jgi:hypothetical protein